MRSSHVNAAVNRSPAPVASTTGPVSSAATVSTVPRSEEHTSELQSRQYLVCRLLLEKNKLRNRLRAWGVTDAELAEFRDRPSPPDVMGINYYLTSDRYLDGDQGKYPESSRSKRTLYA